MSEGQAAGGITFRGCETSEEGSNESNYPPSRLLLYIRRISHGQSKSPQQLHHLHHSYNLTHHEYLQNSSYTRQQITKMEFEGVKKDDDGVYYYDGDELEKTAIPLSDTVEGDASLDRDKLEELFGLTESSLPELPRFLVSPNLSSTWGGYYEHEPEQAWCFLTGNVAVYKPVEWVASVTLVKDWPEGEERDPLPREEVEGPVLRLYEPAELALEIPDLDGCLRARARIKEEVVLGDDLGDLERNVTGDVEQGGVELVLGLMLRVEEVYRCAVPELWLDDRRIGESLNWSGGPGWDELHVPCAALANAEGVKFSEIKMMGEGHSDSLWLAALPVFDGGDVRDLHIVLSCEGWNDWYAYTLGEKGEAGGEKMMAYPQFRPKLAVMPRD